jgi:Rrf2 family iron-sulfur cluster assembly transcriptional regulator
VDATRCQGKGNCQHGEICLTHHLWEDLSQQIHDFLKGISLADLMARQDVRAIASSQEERREIVIRDMRLSS